MRAYKYILFFLVPAILGAKPGLAQLDSVAKATWTIGDTTLSQEVRIKRARTIIDKAANHPDAVNNPYTWYTKALIYKEWYKTFEKQDKESKARINAVEYYKKALSLSTSKDQTFTIKSDIEYNGKTYVIMTDVYNAKNINISLNHIGSTFYNDAASLIEESKYPAAIALFEKFKDCAQIADSTFIRLKEIEFKTVLADQYYHVFLSDIKINLPYYSMAEKLYKEAIALDTNGWSANYNLAMLYYNYGVNIINAMDISTDLYVLQEQITEEARIQHRKALPYALKSHALNPKRKEVLICLEGIYESLYEEEKAAEFKAKADALEKAK